MEICLNVVLFLFSSTKVRAISIILTTRRCLNFWGGGIIHSGGILLLSPMRINVANAKYSNKQGRTRFGPLRIFFHSAMRI